MRRIKEAFLPALESVISLQDTDILEIGCGNGMRSVEIAARCRSLTAIEPNEDILGEARARDIPNATFGRGSAELLPFGSGRFDVVIYTLSFHHVPADSMCAAIGEAIRVLKPYGRIVFLEPGNQGTFFEAEISFDACDGDEREVKSAAYRAMMEHPRLKPVSELPDETVFQFESVEDFVVSMNPKKDISGLPSFLEANGFTLSAERRINIFEIV